MATNICKGSHRGHLCVLASKDMFDEIKKLASKPRYICFNCGRVANCKANVCNPMALKKK